MDSEKFAKVVQGIIEALKPLTQIDQPRNLGIIGDDVREVIENQFKNAAQIVELSHQPTLTQTQVSKLFNIKNRTLEMWRYHNKGPRYFKDGRIILYHQKDVQKYLETGLVRTSDQN